MPTYEIQRVRTSKMHESLTIRANDAENAVMLARVRLTPLDVKKLYEDRNNMYLLVVIEVDPA